MKDELRLQFLQTTAALMTAAFGMVAALAWNEAIKALIARFITSEDGGIWALVIYAVIVTIIAVIATVIIARSVSKLKAKIDEEESAESKE